MTLDLAAGPAATPPTPHGSPVPTPTPGTEAPVGATHDTAIPEPTSPTGGLAGPRPVYRQGPNGLLSLFAPALIVIVIDQIVKLAVHQYMDFGMEGQIKVLGDWFKLHYTLNPGMAFGLELAPPYGKLLLTTFRLLATAGFIYYLIWAWRGGAHRGFLICIALVLGGAIGNLIDSIFYGVFLGNAPAGSPTPWLHGQVVDMFYFDIWEGFIPDWIPFMGGHYYSLWPIFNVADASIFCGLMAIILFQGRLFGPPETTPPQG